MILPLNNPKTIICEDGQFYENEPYEFLTNELLERIRSLKVFGDNENYSSEELLEVLTNIGFTLKWRINKNRYFIQCNNPKFSGPVFKAAISELKPSFSSIVLSCVSNLPLNMNNIDTINPQWEKYNLLYKMRVQREYTIQEDICNNDKPVFQITLNLPSREEVKHIMNEISKEHTYLKYLILHMYIT